MRLRKRRPWPSVFPTRFRSRSGLDGRMVGRVPPQPGSAPITQSCRVDGGGTSLPPDAEEAHGRHRHSLPNPRNLPKGEPQSQGARRPIRGDRTRDSEERKRLRSTWPTRSRSPDGGLGGGLIERGLSLRGRWSAQAVIQSPAGSQGAASRLRSCGPLGDHHQDLLHRAELTCPAYQPGGARRVIGYLPEGANAGKSGFPSVL